MQKFSIEMIPDDPTLLLLLTTDTFSEDAELKVADFRDTHALVHNKSGKFIGYSRIDGMKLGKDPEMIYGIWYLIYDEENTEKYAKDKIHPKSCSLKIIES